MSKKPSQGAMRSVDSNGGSCENSETQWPVHAALLVTQLLSGGYYVIIKMALVHEMNLIVFSVYRDLLALVFLIPAAWLIERLVFLSIPLFKVVLACMFAAGRMHNDTVVLTLLSFPWICDPC
jgi:hypothetical protein